MAWSDSFLRSLKDNDVRLVTYVPDNVLAPLIALPLPAPWAPLLAGIGVLAAFAAAVIFVRRSLK